MANLKLVIKTSEITPTLRGYATKEVEATYMEIPNADAQDAITELTSIGRDYSMYSDTVIKVSGEVDGILLPKKVVEG